MGLEEEIDGVDNSEKIKSSDKFLGVLAVIIGASAITYLAYKLFIEFAEKLPQYLDMNSYISF